MPERTAAAMDEILDLSAARLVASWADDFDLICEHFPFPEGGEIDLEPQR